MATASEILEKSLQAKKAGTTGDAAKTVLAVFWRDRVKMAFSTQQKPLGKKELGQLKLLREYCEASPAPLTGEPLVLSLIDYALNNWHKFIRGQVQVGWLRQPSDEPGDRLPARPPPRRPRDAFAINRIENATTSDHRKFPSSRRCW